MPNQIILEEKDGKPIAKAILRRDGTVLLLKSPDSKLKKPQSMVLSARSVRMLAAGIEAQL